MASGQRVASSASEQARWLDFKTLRLKLSLLRRWEHTPSENRGSNVISEEVMPGCDKGYYLALGKGLGVQATAG